MSMAIHIPPLPEAFLDRVRNRGLDDLGQAVVRRVAQGASPAATPCGGRGRARS
jgi:hypothetical protein